MLELKSMKASYKAETVSVKLTDGYYNLITRIKVPGLTRKNKGLVFLRINDLMHLNISWEMRCERLSGQCYGGIFLGDCKILSRRRMRAKKTTTSNTRQI